VDGSAWAVIEWRCSSHFVISCHPSIVGAPFEDQSQVNNNKKTNLFNMPKSEPNQRKPLIEHSGSYDNLSSETFSDSVSQCSSVSFIRNCPTSIQPEEKQEDKTTVSNISKGKRRMKAFTSFCSALLLVPFQMDDIDMRRNVPAPPTSVVSFPFL